MAIEITVPRLGWSMEEGIFVEWLKQDGDTIEFGDLLYTLEGDKAIQEIEAIDRGVLRIPRDGPAEGDTVTVGTVLAFLCEENEPAPLAASTASAIPGDEKVDSPAVVNATQTSSLRVSASAAFLVAENSQPTQRETPRISPRAARVAAEWGVDVSQLQGTGRNGRIREKDVQAVAHNQRISTEQPAETKQTGDVCVVTPARRTIAGRMMQSRQCTAPVTLINTVNATNLVLLREQFHSTPDALGGSVPRYTDLIAKLTAGALAEHPRLNARWQNDQIVEFRAVHIGMAADTEAGLLVPVLRDVGKLSLREIVQQSRTLIEKARSRQLTAGELQGSTFTITNLGSFGIDAFTPIINYPECAVLGIGQIAKQPAVVENQIVPRETVTLSLTFDHRIVDGAPAARFLQTLREHIENPGPWLMP